MQGTLMRVTIHLVSARDYWPLTLAIRQGRRELWLRARREGPSAARLAAAAKRLRRRLATIRCRAGSWTSWSAWGASV